MLKYSCLEYSSLFTYSLHFVLLNMALFGCIFYRNFPVNFITSPGGMLCLHSKFPVSCFLSMRRCADVFMYT